MRKKGQVSTETIVAIVVVLVIFVVLILFVFVKNQEVQEFNALNVQRSTCSKLAFVIEAFQSDNATNSITVDLFEDANIKSGFIQVSDFECSFSGNVESAELYAGKVRVERRQGVVSFEQVE